MRRGRRPGGGSDVRIQRTLDRERVVVGSVVLPLLGRREHVVDDGRMVMPVPLPASGFMGVAMQGDGLGSRMPRPMCRRGGCRGSDAGGVADDEEPGDLPDEAAHDQCLAGGGAVRAGSPDIRVRKLVPEDSEPSPPAQHGARGTGTAGHRLRRRPGTTPDLSRGPVRLRGPAEPRSPPRALPAGRASLPGTVRSSP